MSSRKYFVLFAAVLFVAAISPVAVQAIPLNEVQNLANNGGLATYTTASSVFVKVLNALLAMAFILAVIFVVISGYRMIVSAGNAEQVEAAKKNLFWTIGGIVVIALAWVILTLITNFVLTGNP